MFILAASCIPSSTPVAILEAYNLIALGIIILLLSLDIEEGRNGGILWSEKLWFSFAVLVIIFLSVREWKLFSFSKLLKDHSRLPFFCHYEGFILLGTALTHCRTYYGHTPQLSFMRIYAQRAVIPGSVIVDGKRSWLFHWTILQIFLWIFEIIFLLEQFSLIFPSIMATFTHLICRWRKIKLQFVIRLYK